MTPKEQLKEALENCGLDVVAQPGQLSFMVTGVADPRWAMGYGDKYVNLYFNDDGSFREVDVSDS